MLKRQVRMLRWLALMVVGVVLALSLASIPGVGYAAFDPPPRPGTLAQAQSLEQQGRDLYRAGRFADAIAVWQRAIATANQPLQQARLWSHLALAYQPLGQWSEADAAIQQALSHLQEVRADEGEWLQAQVLDIQGQLYLSQGQAETALTTWQHAFEMYDQMGDRLEDQSLLVRNQINQSHALRSLGLYHQAHDRLTEATQRLQAQPASALKALGLRTLGNVLRVIGDEETAEQRLNESLAIARSLSDPEAIAETLLSLGNLAAENRHWDAAFADYEEARAIAPNPITQVSAQLQQLRLHLAQQNWTEAQAHLPPLLAQLETLPLSHRSLYARIDLVQQLLTASESSQIEPILPDEQLAEQGAIAIRQARSLSDPRAEAEALGTLGHLYERVGQRSEAEDLTRQALLLSQTVNAADLSYQWQWQLGRLLNAKGERPGAIAAYEAAIDALQSVRYDLVAVNPDIQFSFRDEVEPVYRQFVELLLQPDDPNPDLDKARLAIESLQIAELNNFLREACLDAEQGLDQVVEEQAQTAAVIYPIILPNQLAVILTLPQQPLQYYTTPVDRDTVQSTLTQLRQDLVRPQRIRSVQQLSQQLYDWLIRPAEAALTQENIDTLVFVLDGELRNVPMAALYDGDRYLLETYSIALTPSLQLIAPKPLEEVDLRVIAAGVSEPRPGFSALPYVPVELQTIQSELPSQVLLDDEFTIAALQTQVQTRPFPVVHLATHGKFSSQADETFIVAWDQRIYVNDMRRVLQARLQNPDDAIELLVLSACQTAEGDRRAILGLAGVAIRAGARSTLASLWNVNDESTAQLMSAFYRALRDGVPKAKALRQAQLELMHNGRYQRPLYWSPYVLIGNWL